VASSLLDVYLRLSEASQVGAFKELLVDSLQKALTGVEVRLNSGWVVLTRLVKQVFDGLEASVAGRVKLRVIEVRKSVIKIIQGLLWNVDGSVSEHKNIVSECIRGMMKVKPRDQQFRSLVNLNFQLAVIVGLMRLEGNVEEVHVPVLGEDNLIHISRALQLESSRVLYYRQTELLEDSSSFLDGYLEVNLNLLPEITPQKYGLNNYLYVLLTSVAIIKVYQELYQQNLPKFRALFNSFLLPSLDDALTIAENAAPTNLHVLSNALEVFTAELFAVLERLADKDSKRSLFQFLLANAHSRADYPNNVFLL
jgi:hypothetical protein